jgi:hypothetical protein
MCTSRSRAMAACSKRSRRRAGRASRSQPAPSRLMIVRCPDRAHIPGGAPSQDSPPARYVIASALIEVQSKLVSHNWPAWRRRTTTRLSGCVSPRTVCDCWACWRTGGRVKRRAYRTPRGAPTRRCYVPASAMDIQTYVASKVGRSMMDLQSNRIRDKDGTWCRPSRPRRKRLGQAKTRRVALTPWWRTLSCSKYRAWLGRALLR